METLETNPTRLAKPNVTRLAPSPTGALHLGNLRTFIVNWSFARRNGWRVLLRIDDLEGPRNRPGAIEMAVEDLAWLGLDWDERLPMPSARVPRYEAALDRLAEDGHLFPCSCSRSEAIALAAGLSEDGAAIYGGRCANRSYDERTKDDALRVRVGDTSRFATLSGGVEQRSMNAIGPFVVRRADGAISYQLASAVDDLDAGVTHIVRGDDLRDSTFRQTYLRRLLQPDAAEISYMHLPLVVGPDGRKLAKRHGDTRATKLRDLGWSPGRVRRLLAAWCGFDLAEEATPLAWAEAFELDRVPCAPIVFDPVFVGLT